MVLASLLGIALGLTLLRNGITGALHEHDSSNIGRLFILQQTWRMVMLHPFLGWGYGGFTWSFSHFIAQHGLSWPEQTELSHPHNEFLYWWVEGGLTALAGIVLLTVCGIRLFFHRPEREKMAILGCLLPILLHTQLEYPLYQSPVHWLILILLLSFADNVKEESSGLHRVFQHSSLNAIPCLIGMLACCGVCMTTLTFWQELCLTKFQQTPQHYATQVLKLHETGIGTERLRKDKAFSWITHYQNSGNIEDLQIFSSEASRRLNTWMDPEIYYNLITVQHFLGQTENALQIKRKAHQLYPYDPRFFP